MDPAIRLSGIRKRFGVVAANDGIALELRFGEILALLGENGSGKTTLVNMLSGIYQPDGGHIHVRGKIARIASPRDAQKLGIGMVHQHFKLVEAFTAQENIQMGGPAGREARQRMQALSALQEEYGLHVPPDKRVREMSVSEKQCAEILKLLYRGADILILDEPTAVLTPQESDALFAMLRRMRANGCAVIIITHKLSEVLALSDRVTVLRKGKSVATVQTSETNAKQLTELMVGRPVELRIARPEPLPDEEPLLDVQGLRVKTGDTQALRNLSFTLRGGEILGVAGIAGGGQKELCESIAGLAKAERGEIRFRGGNILGLSPADIIKRGISMSFIPEDRLGMGLVASMDITSNMLLKTYRAGRGPLLKRSGAKAMASKLIERLEISTPGPNTPVRQLSGGNVQKVLLGREIESGPRLLITAYAVRGLDTHSSFTIYDLLNRQKERGVGILFIGEDLDVLLELCDRILVLCRGECMGIVEAKEATKEQLGLMMAGMRKEEAA
ncbi:MAG: ABC transporter ATP-binding protein [Oscillospiraceae bacterium]|jgi:simple sugar transport system ATP-binding protein|nr:ABC transporter ATP-binding protein [Oscillospiraceae bacterium]